MSPLFMYVPGLNLTSVICLPPLSAMTATYIMTQAVATTSLLKDLLLAAEEGRLHDIQSLLDKGRCKVNDEDEVCTIGTVI